ncbi:nacrein-like protein [Saccostrea cucullata]|uniref:nacrein-like protein n=1 Tax=Saccostrea cuccullata TaxID=36930 RepID=UPI002ED21116
MIKICNKGHDKDYARHYNRRRYKGHRRCKVRFAKTLSEIMTTYYRKIRMYNGKGYTIETRETQPPCHPEKLQQSFIKEHCIMNVGSSHAEVSLCGISPLDVLPYDRRFYTYKGSLTTPPCFKTVQWIVHKCPIKVTREAFQALRNVQDSHHDPLSEMGIRRPQQKNKHPVFKNF